jgi:hypothetical protein
MTNRWDVAVYDRDDQLVLVVEAKTKRGAGKDWAANLRRNILAHGVYPNAPFFLIAFPDRFYLWTQSNTKLGYSLPDYTIDAEPLLKRYFTQSGIDPQKVSGRSFELIVSSWISEIVNSDRLPTEKWLIDSGLYATIAGGRLEHEVTV